MDDNKDILENPDLTERSQVELTNGKGDDDE